MAVSLTCVCGALLEIDDKFKGQKIPCPDCNRLLDTTPPPPPPQTTSGWALSSLVLSLAGMLTLIGPIAAIVCGVLGLRQIRGDSRIGGRNYAQVGIGLGAFFTLISVWALTSTEFLGLDGFLRICRAHDIRFPTDLVVHSALIDGEHVVSLKRPSLNWGVRQGSNSREYMILEDLWDDAHIVVFKLNQAELLNEPEPYRDEAVMGFLRTSLAETLSQHPKDEPPKADQVKITKIISENEKEPGRQEFQVEVLWQRIPRVFLFRIFTQRNIHVAVGGARANRFDGLEKPLRDALNSCVLERKE